MLARITTSKTNYVPNNVAQSDSYLGFNCQGHKFINYIYLCIRICRIYLTNENSFLKFGYISCRILFVDTQLILKKYRRIVRLEEL